MIKLSFDTPAKQAVVDITAQIEAAVAGHSGVAVVHLLHTTAALTIGELEPGLADDMIDALNQLMPTGDYRHAQDKAHIGAHVFGATIGPSLSLIVEDGQVQLGQWQKILLVELDGPRTRRVLIRLLS
jgi:secondary thiamine-phosphate synthase enzyme